MSVDQDLAAARLRPLPRTAWLEIDLDAIVANVAAIVAAVPLGVAVEPVVKADAYGHGAIPVAWSLAARGIDGFGVATWDEAVELRDAGLASPILVLYPVPASFAPDAARLGITLTVGDQTLLARTIATVERATLPTPMRVELEIETGLGRGGLPLESLPAAIAAIRASPYLDLVGAWSHLGSPDDPDRSLRQWRAFDAARELLAGQGMPVARQHLAASGGILADAVPLHGGTRPGLSTYGVVPEGLPIAPAAGALASSLRPAMRLLARPVRVVDLPAGSGVSYGNAHVTDRPSRIATLPLGYADGFQRVRTNRAQALVRGQAVPLVGTIAMDAIMADVTDVTGSPVTVDDEFVLLGEQAGRTLTAADLARSGTTISWEVLSGMARRLPRVYYAAARAVGVRTLTDDVGPWRDLQSATLGDGRRSSGDPPPP